MNIEVVVHNIPLSVPAYVRDPEADARQAGYVETMRLRSEDDAARTAIVTEMQRVAQAVRRAKAVAAVLGVVEDVEEIERLAGSVAARIEETPPSAQT